MEQLGKNVEKESSSWRRQRRRRGTVMETEVKQEWTTSSPSVESNGVVSKPVPPLICVPQPGLVTVHCWQSLPAYQYNTVVYFDTFLALRLGFLRQSSSHVANACKVAPTLKPKGNIISVLMQRADQSRGRSEAWPLWWTSSQSDQYLVCFWMDHQSSKLICASKPFLRLPFGSNL